MYCHKLFLAFKNAWDLCLHSPVKICLCREKATYSIDALAKIFLNRIMYFSLFKN
jgi:hypothetical protein